MSAPVPNGGRRRMAPPDQVKINQDAIEFGLHMKQGGWRLGLLVARNVVVAPGRIAPETLAPKVNATEFARRAGTSNDRVIRHYAAWERAANAGLVPHAADLQPGGTVDLDVERLPSWGPIYNAPLERRTPQPRPIRTPPAPVVITHTAASSAPPASEPVAALPDIDDVVEDAPRRMNEALDAIRDEDYDAEAAATARDAEWSDDVRYAVNAIMGHARRLADAARDPEWVNPQQRERAAEDMVKLSKQFAMIADIVTDPSKGTMTDADLSALLNA